ncbi:DNA-dependent RNA polymerase subunit epsilon [Oceanobacillus kapialis]|uniref:DNA-directed RNA polymerase subunit epsilon n=1 Tax=Oceanobacillus kapialis TaxID=481353 RepID=A0ABW5PXZ7_9BACI
MIYKVLYQELRDEIPVRERTKSAYVEADSMREVRSRLSEKKYNIEYIHVLDEAHLEYEKQSESFKLENAQ